MQILNKVAGCFVMKLRKPAAEARKIAAYLSAPEENGRRSAEDLFYRSLSFVLS
jgi:hypothetical protein